MSKQGLYAALAGALFGLGLAISGMMEPPKVLGFLNITGLFDGTWDPSLAFVMGGALLVTIPAFMFVPKKDKPWAAAGFSLPTRKDIDAKLVCGAALFGIGWGLAGYCPGPAFASILSGGYELGVFVLMMLLGMFLAKKLSK